MKNGIRLTVCLTVFALVVAMAAAPADAGWLFGRFRGPCATGACQLPATPAVAYQRTVTRTTTAYVGENATAAGVARIMARLGRVGHFGGNPGYEGCGSGPTPQAAYNNCCFANSGMRTVDYGIAQGANGMYYCCRRYSR